MFPKYFLDYYEGLRRVLRTTFFLTSSTLIKDHMY